MIAVLSLVAGGCGGSGAGHVVLPGPVDSGPPTVQQPVPVVADDSGIPGVVAYDTSSAGAGALGHGHVAGPVTYSVTPPVGGDHNPKWMNCGAYPEPVPAERAVHDLEHGAVWITYRPDLAKADVDALGAFLRRQQPVTVTVRGSTVDTHQRYVALTPFPGLPAPIVITAWAHQLRVDTPSDPRLQRFVDTFRASPKYSPEYGSPCGGEPPKIGGTPAFS